MKWSMATASYLGAFVMSDTDGPQRKTTVEEAGAKGGNARAARLSPEERQDIARRAAESRWNTSIPVASHTGEFTLAGRTIACAVLETGQRVLTQEAFMVAIGRSPKQKGGQSLISPDGLPPFLSSDNLKPFISDDLKQATVPVVFRSPPTGTGRGQRGKRAYGYDANLLAMVCEVYLAAKDAGCTTKQQEHIVRACSLITRALARVAIAALIDEATGYQEVRDRRALQAILDRYLRQEFAAWAKRFPDEFYREMFRLRGWTWKGMKVNRPQCVAAYTKDLIYERLAPGILEELEQRNPVQLNGRRTSAHHQWLTADIGHPALAQHLHAVIGLMRASPDADWDFFIRLIDRAFKRRGHSVQLDIFDFGVPILPAPPDEQSPPAAPS
jgi:hypothetical protein